MLTKESLLQSLIAAGHLKNPRLIESFREIDRADFVRPEYAAEAYENYPLPIGEGQTISQPQTAAFMLELLNPQPGERILDIGVGSGWQSALIAYVLGESGRVTAVERIPALCEFARENLDKYGFVAAGRVSIHCRDAAAALPDGRYDKVIAAAASDGRIPEYWRDLVRVGGRIVAPVGNSVWVFDKKPESEWEEREFKGFQFVPLVKEADQESSIKSQADAKAARKIFSILVSCLLFLVSIFLYEVYLPHSPARGAREVKVAQGMGSRQIGALLKQEGVIRSKWAFVAYISLKGIASSLKPGVYAFVDSTIPEIAAALAEGAPDERIITIPEGWATKEIGAYLEKNGIGSAADFAALTSAKGSGVFTERFPFLRERPSGAGLEGYLFPDTYHIYPDASPEDVIVKMLENFERKADGTIPVAAGERAETLFEIITMASLIEREVATDEDRAIVSGILWKRLDAGIPLQVDATITYLTGKKTTRISRAETEIDSPYNTYKYRGLPAGPIANPGLSAIRAARSPQAPPYLFYLSAPDGRTIFSRTLEEHNAAKRTYLR